MSELDRGNVEETKRALLAALPALWIALLTRAPEAAAQDAVQMQPQSYRVAFENDRIRVLDFHSRPGLGVCGNGMHSHPAHLTVALSPAKVKVTTPEGKTFVGENKLGDVFWDEAETHETENISGHDVRALIVELKQPGKA